jgi:hypothetical protein
MSYFKFLNRDVEREVVHNWELFLMWKLSYDDEIDPIHNPDWLKRAQENEAEVLVRMKTDLERLRIEYQTYPKWLIPLG